MCRKVALALGAKLLAAGAEPTLLACESRVVRAALARLRNKTE